VSLRRFDQLIGCIRQRLGAFHDRRTGKNKKYTMEDIALSAFSVFYTQCPSFLASQSAMQQNKGRSNAQTLFQIAKIPFCRRVLRQRSHFIFTCLPESHTHLYQWIGLLDQGRDLHTVTLRVKDAKRRWEEQVYRYANGVPLVEGEGALKVNWCEVTTTGKHRKSPGHNAWVTDWKIDDDNVAGIAATGPCRWRIENENNHTLKTKGYHTVPCPSAAPVLPTKP